MPRWALSSGPDEQGVGHAGVAGSGLEGAERRVDVEPVVGVATAYADDREGRRPGRGSELPPASQGEGAQAGRRPNRRP